MEWASLDSFAVPDPFWQDKMGKPVANRDFMGALLTHGALPRYRFHYLDEAERDRHRAQLAAALPTAALARAELSTHAALAAQLERGAPADIFHQGDFTFHAPYLADLRSRRPPSQIFAISGVTHSLDGAALYGKLVQILLAGPRPYDAIICTSACAVTALTQAFAAIRAAFTDRLGAALPEPPPLVQIPLGLSEGFERPRVAADDRRALGLPADALVLLGLGRFSVRRKMDLSPFLECLRAMRDELPPTVLVLAGGGGEADIALVQDMVYALGLADMVRIEPNLPVDRKHALYGAADIFVSLVDNHQETFGLTVIEAMAHGLPTVVSEFNGYRELVREGETGFRIPTFASAEAEPWESLAGLLDPSILAFQRSQKVAFDFRALRGALLSLARDASLRRRLGEAGRVQSQAYRWDKIIPRYEALWREQNDAVRHARAQDDPHPNHAPAPLLTPALRSMFGHYASRTMSRSTRLAVSDYARARVAEGFTPTIYEGLKPQLSFPVMQAIMGALEMAPSLGEVVDRVQRGGAVSAHRVMLNLDFLIKHGYIDVLSDEPPGPIA